MVLKQYFIFLLVYIIGINVSFAQNSNIAHTDAYGSNYFINTSEFQKVSFTSDVLGLVNENVKADLKRITDDFFESQNIQYENSYLEESNAFVYEFSQLPHSTFKSLSYQWNLKYAIVWENSILEILAKLPSKNKSYKTFYEAYFIKSMLAENLIAKQSRAISDIKLSFYVTSAELDRIEETINFVKSTVPYQDDFKYNETIIVEECKEPSLLISGPNTKGFTKDKIVFYIFNTILKNYTNTKLEFGVSKSFLIIENNETMQTAKPDEIFSKENFERAKAKSNFRIAEKIFENNIFFSNTEEERWQAILDSTSYEYFNIRIEQILSFKKLNILPKGSNEDLLGGLWIFKDTVQMKRNSIKVKNSVDSTTIKQVNNFIQLNPSTHITILGFANNSEFVKISTDKRNEIIAVYNASSNDYVKSKKTNLQLIRSIAIFNQLVEMESKISNLRCSGLAVPEEETENVGVVFLLNK